LAIVATVSLSGGKAYASGTNCGPETDGLSEICMYIDGYSNVVVAAVGEVTITSPKDIAAGPGRPGADCSVPPLTCQQNASGEP